MSPRNRFLAGDRSSCILIGIHAIALKRFHTSRKEDRWQSLLKPYLIVRSKKVRGEEAIAEIPTIFGVPSPLSVPTFHFVAQKRPHGARTACDDALYMSTRLYTESIYDWETSFLSHNLLLLPPRHATTWSNLQSGMLNLPPVLLVGSYIHEYK